MSSNYPTGYDNLSARTDASPATPDAHAQDHTDERDAINAIEAELGLEPSGASATVKARLDALDTTVAGKEAAGVAAALVDDLSGVTNATTARTNLGLGTAAVKDAPATGNATTSQVVLGSDTRLTDARTPSSTLSHASTHGSGGTDPITIANTQVTGLGTISTQAASNVSITGGSITGITDLAVADGGTGASDAGTARTNLGLGSIATQAANNVSITGGSITGISSLKAQPTVVTFSNVNYTVTATASVFVQQVGTMSAARTVTLPAASSFNTGDELIILDASGTVTSTNNITIQRAGSDTIDGATSITIAAAWGWRRFISNGSNTWLFDAGVLRASNNLSDIASASTARTNLGLAIGSDVQAYDADLNAIAALSTTGLVSRTGSGTAATRTITGGTGLTVTNGDGAAGDPTLALDQDLQDVAGLTRNKGDLIVGGTSAWLDLAVGANGTMLFADSAETTGVKWAQYRSQALKFNTDDYWLLSRSCLALGYSATSTGTTATNSNNAAVYTPFSVAEEISIKALALHCVTANAGANAVVRLGIYNADATTGRPSTVLVDGGTVSINSTATIREVSFTTVTLKPGFYWYVVCTQSLDTAGTNPQFSGPASSSAAQAAQETAPAVSNNLFGAFVSSSAVTGAFGASPGVSITRGTAARMFHVWAKVA